ncbi:dipeptidyl-peptidase 3 family protein [Calditrichota bacterium LG25]
MKRILLVLLMLVFLGAIACQKKEENKTEMVKLKRMIAQFAPTEIKYDHSLLDERKQKVVENLYRAAKIMDEIFLDQVYFKNFEIREQLRASSDPLDQLRLEYFTIMFGPFDRLNHDKPFIGNTPKPKGANYYPPDMTREEFENWLKAHPEDEAAFTSEFTVIRRQNGKLVAIPYSEYYKEYLTRAADYLKKAAEFADNPSLKKYLQLRAEAFLNNDYYESDLAWMDLKDHTIEVVIGPYEVYEDKLFNYKAAFEAFITLRDPVESAKLKKFAGYLDEMEKNLPIPDAYKNFNRGSESPMVVVQEVFSAGDTKAGVQTLAFNLPNDERVREAKGSKKVMLKNIHEAKFDKLLKPIAEKVLFAEQLPLVTFEGFFNHTLMHEISHGLGPGKIVLNGRQTEVKKELKETYSSIEECKADVLGMYNNLFMIEKGVYPPEFEKQIYVTFLAGIFRSIRFGINEAHGAGNAVIFNYLLEKGAYQFDPAAHRVKVNFEKIKDGVRDLANKVLTIQAQGDYMGAKQLLEKYGVESEPIMIMRARLQELPVDIKPIFQIEKELGSAN